MKDVRTVIWDCDSLMWFHRKDEPEVVAKAMGIKEIVEFTYEYYDFFNSFLLYFKNKKVTECEMYKLVQQKIPILYFYQFTPQQFLKVLERVKFLTNDFNQDSLTLIKYLYSKGLKNIVKSDWWRNVQEDMLKAYGIMDYIEELHCCDSSYLKCNPLSAQGIIKKGREEQYVILGDSLSNDIAFAQHTGIKSIWFNHKGEKVNDTLYKPTFEVSSLLEVMEMI